MNHRQASEPVEESISTWLNPTESDQTVVFFDTNPKGTKFVVKAGSQREIPGRYDFAIQKVMCSDDACRLTGHGFCVKGHQGQVIGGMAPSLLKVEQSRETHPLDPALDPHLALKRAAEAKAAAAMIARSGADEALLLAKAEEIRAEVKIAEVAEKSKAKPDDDHKGYADPISRKSK